MNIGTNSEAGQETEFPNTWKNICENMNMETNWITNAQACTQNSNTLKNISENMNIETNSEAGQETECPNTWKKICENMNTETNSSEARNESEFQILERTSVKTWTLILILAKQEMISLKWTFF